jgi:hypothetical protein
MTISNCNLNGGTSLQWWTGSMWTPVSPQTYSSGPPACVTATLGTNSAPTIAQLTGTVFAIVKASSVPTLTRVTVTNTKATVTITCTGTTRCTATLRLTATETLKSSKVVAVAAQKKTAPTTKTVILASASMTILAGRTQTIRLTLNHTAATLLARFHKLPAELTLTQGTAAPLATRRLTFTITTKH